MKRLSETWYVDGVIDFEQKQYVLLGYLQGIEKSFSNAKLYPELSDLGSHLVNLQSYKKNRDFLFSNFPKSISKFSLSEKEIQYEYLFEEDEYLKVVDEIIDWSLPKFDSYIEEGKKIQQHIEDNTSVEFVGLRPLNINIGYLLIADKMNHQNQTHVYEYAITFYPKSDSALADVKTKYVCTFLTSIIESPEAIKSKILKKFAQNNTLDYIANPATFAINANYDFPLEASLMPVVKKKIAKIAEA